MITLLGILGGIVLVAGAAWPVRQHKHPAMSIKNWLYAIGAFILTVFAYLDYHYNNASFFFVILEIYAIVASVFMLINLDEKISTWILSIVGIMMVVWSLFLYENSTTAVYIIGLIGVAIGYVLTTGTKRRNVAFFIGSTLLTVFSFLTGGWVFFWLNLFFAGFSGWHAFGIKYVD